MRTEQREDEDEHAVDEGQTKQAQVHPILQTCTEDRRSMFTSVQWEQDSEETTVRTQVCEPGLQGTNKRFAATLGANLKCVNMLHVLM